jgi:hypothetical protein
MNMPAVIRSKATSAAVYLGAHAVIRTITFIP